MQDGKTAWPQLSGIDISEEYCKIASERVMQEALI